VTRLDRSLRKHDVDAGVRAAIMAGAEEAAHGAKPEAKAAWFRGAMERMDALLDMPTRRSVREACACCLGNKRLECSKAIARDHDTLEARIAAANETPFVFGHSVTREPDGRILVRFEPDDRREARCVCLRKAGEPISETYCYCCGGHIKHHLQIALGRRLTCELRSSALSSGGTRPCSFWFTLVA
jgi:hypothetical protein